MYAVILVSSKNISEARKISRKLILNKIAACVSIIPKVESLYRWKGKIECSRESLLIVKTKQNKAREAIKAIKSAHSYEVPEIISFKIQEGYGPYLRWIDESLG